MLKICRTILVVFLLCWLTSPALAAPEAGRVLSVTQGAWVDQGGSSLPAAVKDSVQTDATLRTDASGRLQLLLNDHSSITLSSNTRFTMESFTFGEGAPAQFKGHLGQGLARVITGKITELNPAGFKITTPEGTVGIRGTVFSLESLNGTTTLYVENTTRGGVYLNDRLVPTDHKAIISPGREIIITPMTRQERSALAGQTAVLTSKIENKALTPLEAPNLGDLVLADIGNPQNILRAASPTAATVSGTLNNSSNVYMGVFSFDVSLTSGSITNAAMSGNNGSSGFATDISVFNLYGGSGSIGNNAGGITRINGFSASTLVDGVNSNIFLGDLNVSTGFTLSAANSSTILSGSGTIVNDIANNLQIVTTGSSLIGRIGGGTVTPVP